MRTSNRIITTSLLTGRSLNPLQACLLLLVQQQQQPHSPQWGSVTTPGTARKLLQIEAEKQAKGMQATNAHIAASFCGSHGYHGQVLQLSHVLYSTTHLQYGRRP
jgi:hypothetical protein